VAPIDERYVLALKLIPQDAWRKPVVGYHLGVMHGRAMIGGSGKRWEWCLKRENTKLGKEKSENIGFSPFLIRHESIVCWIDPTHGDQPRLKPRREIQGASREDPSRK
jgi:hypothetical protein